MYAHMITMEIMQLMTVWSSNVHQAWKPCVDKNNSKGGLCFP